MSTNKGMSYHEDELTRLALRAEPFPRASPDPSALREAVLANRAYRRVLRTDIDSRARAARVQQVAMYLPHGERLGWETHATTSQLFVVVAGTGSALLGPQPNASSARSFPLAPGSTWVVEPGTYHDVLANGAAGETLALFTVYVPAQHEYGEVNDHP